MKSETCNVQERGNVVRELDCELKQTSQSKKSSNKKSSKVTQIAVRSFRGFACVVQKPNDVVSRARLRWTPGCFASFSLEMF